MLYLQKTKPRLALKLFRGEPAISGFDWNFSPTHTSCPPFQRMWLRSSIVFTTTSTWTWIDHPVSGLRTLTLRPLKTWFPFGSTPVVLNLASKRSSPDRSTKVRGCSFKELPQLVNTGFVFSFTPLRVLFTFPSQYYALSVTK